MSVLQAKYSFKTWQGKFWRELRDTPTGQRDAKQVKEDRKLAWTTMLQKHAKNPMVGILKDAKMRSVFWAMYNNKLHDLRPDGTMASDARVLGEEITKRYPVLAMASKRMASPLQPKPKTGARATAKSASQKHHAHFM